MRKIVSKFALAAGVSLALAFTFSCSSDGGSSGATYWYSVYGITNSSFCNNLTGFFSVYGYRSNPSYDKVKEGWSIIKQNGSFMESNTGWTEQEIRDFLVQRDVSPKDADDGLTHVKKNGNAIAAFISDSYYCAIMVYVERE